MTDIWMDLPTGRRLEQPGHDPNYVGTLGPLRRADEARLRLARRNLREIAAKDIEGEGRYLRDKTSGETLEVVTSFVDLVDPKSSGVVAFTVRDSLLVPLRPLGWQHEADESATPARSSDGRRRAGTPCPCPWGTSSDHGTDAVLGALAEDVLARGGLEGVGEGRSASRAEGDGATVTARTGAQSVDGCRPASRPAAEFRPVRQAEQA